MCSTSSPTAFTGGPIQIVGTVQPPGPGSSQPLTPFAATHYPSPDFTKDSKLQPALESAKAEMAAQLGPKPVAFSFLFRNANGSTRYAGVDDDLMHYSASMLKVAAMYAAHELLAAAKRLAAIEGEHRASPDAFFSDLKSRFDTMIKDAAAPLKAAGKVRVTDGSNVLDAAERVAANVTNPITGVRDYRSTPSYSNIFEVFTPGAGEPVVKFAPVFANKMKKMIEDSDDPAAGECIRRLSYTYINAALMKGGFYDPASPNGIWLAGDYTGLDANPSSVARIMTQNDGLAAQVTTTKQMLRMVKLISSNQLVPIDNTNPMKDLLGLAAALGGFLRRELLGTDPPFELKLSKIGVGPLKAPPSPAGMSTYSEVQFMKWTQNPPNPVAKGLKDEFFVCWQNLQQPGTSRLPAIVEVITRTVTKLTNAL